MVPEIEPAVNTTGDIMSPLDIGFSFRELHFLSVEYTVVQPQGGFPGRRPFFEQDAAFQMVLFGLCHRDRPF